MKDGRYTDSFFSRHITSKDTPYCKSCSQNERRSAHVGFHIF